ncbi:hypothetical protein KAR28_00170 [Candidatus Parcubacteria bacterium]|nr:hypothetical protein [Candidatus Parcubacteria bacterium]
MLKLKYLVIIVFIFLISGLGFVANELQAGTSFKESFDSSLTTTAGKTGHLSGTNPSFFNTKDPAEIVGQVIKILLSLLGIVFLILLIYGGYIWMTDRGEEKQATKARDIIRNAIIGLIIVLAAYAITNLVMMKIWVAI